MPGLFVVMMRSASMRPPPLRREGGIERTDRARETQAPKNNVRQKPRAAYIVYHRPPRISRNHPLPGSTCTMGAAAGMCGSPGCISGSAGADMLACSAERPSLALLV